MNVNPGSGNPIGGQAVALHTHGRTVDEMVLRSPSGVKSALGENPKNVYKEKGRTPSTRLGTALVIREAFLRAQGYMARRAEAEREDKPFTRDPHLDALALVLERTIRELRGEPCIDLEEPQDKQTICSSRMFGKPS